VAAFHRAALLTAALMIAAACSGPPAGEPQPSPASPGAPTTSPVAPTAAAGTGVASTAPTPTLGSAGVPRFAHIVVVILENHAYSEIVGSVDAPFLNALAASGAVLTQSYAITHPSQPNYLALFSGSTQQLTDDSCPHSYAGPNLAATLIAAGRTFVGYSDNLPSMGFAGCSSGPYARKHNPWVDFRALPATINQPMTAFPAEFGELPDVSFVIPDLDHDMHDGTIGESDQWLREHLGDYARWAPGNDSLLIVTADEDDSGHGNRIPTIIAGAHVRPGPSAAQTDHYGMLRTLLASFALPPFGSAGSAHPITGIWSP
jgi:acid phosphatase